MFFFSILAKDFSFFFSLLFLTHTYTHSQIKIASNILSIYFEGKALCMLTEEMFKQRVPNSGDILYRALKNLLPKTHQEQQQQQQQQQLSQPQLGKP